MIDQTESEGMRVDCYSVCRSSVVEWLREVPAHWDVRRLGALGRFFKGNGGTKADDAEDGVPCIRYGDLYTRHRFHITASNSCVPSHRAGDYTSVRYGDVLFAGSGETLEEIGKSAVNLIRGTTVCGGDVIVFRPTIDLDAEFMGWCTDYRHAACQKARMGKGITVMHIYASELRCLIVPLPPLAEQTAIVRFLGHAHRRIQRYIRAKERLIKLLEEQKQAIVHQAVTGQIDVRTGQPYPAYKDSGVEWLGEVPEHWEVVRARYVFGEIDQRSRDGSEQHLSMSQRLGLVPSHLVENRTLVSKSYAGGKLCEVDDVVLNRLKAHLGVFALARHQGVVSPDYTVLRLRRVGTMEFFERLLRSTGFRWELRVRAKGIVEGFWRLYTDDFNQIKVPVPPVEEQIGIASWMRSTGDRIKRLVAAASRHIDLLREYRTRLIADVVTGKLDVREAAASLPETDPLTADDATDNPATQATTQGGMPTPPHPHP